MNDAPLIRTERLELWQPRAGDLASLAKLTRAEETRRYLGSFVPSEADAFARLHRNAGSWALHGYGTFMVRWRGGAPIIGNCGVFRSHRGFGADWGMDDVAEAGWIVHAEHTGKGVAREAMEAALSWFDATHGHQPIKAMIDTDNAPSHALATRLGFAEYARHTPEAGGGELVLYRRG